MREVTGKLIIEKEQATPCFPGAVPYDFTWQGGSVATITKKLIRELEGAGLIHASAWDNGSLVRIGPYTCKVLSYAGNERRGFYTLERV